MKTNREWMELLSKEWDVSNTTAKEMVHAMHKLKEQADYSHGQARGVLSTKFSL